MRVIRFKNEKQQYNLLNCNDLNHWYDTCVTRATEFLDVCEVGDYCQCDAGEQGNEEISFEFTKNDVYKKLILTINNKENGILSTPYEAKLIELGESFFWNCKNCFKNSNLTNLIKFPSTKYVINMSYMFSGCGKLTSYQPILSFDTSNVTDMSHMFEDCKFSNLDLSKWNTSNVTLMNHMFMRCDNLTELNLSSFNTSKVTDMTEMFLGCTNFPKFNLSNFNTSNVTSMDGMFYGCEKVTEFDLTSFNTSKVIDMEWMFSKCRNLKSLDLTSFNTSNVKYLKNMFLYCDNITELDLSGWNTSKVTNLLGMFRGCEKLTTLNLSGWDLDNTNVSGLKNIFGVYIDFNGDIIDDRCNSLTTIYMRGCTQETVDKIRKAIEDCDLDKNKVQVITN